MSWPYQGLPMMPQHDNPDRGEEYEFDWDSFWYHWSREEFLENSEDLEDEEDCD